VSWDCDADDVAAAVSVVAVASWANAANGEMAMLTTTEISSSRAMRRVIMVGVLCGSSIG